MTTKSTLVTALALTTALGLSACGAAGGSNPMEAPSSAAGTAAAGQIIVGSANFPESELLMNIYAGAIKAKGVQVSTKPNIGSRETYLPALKDGSINVVPEYTGVLATYFDKNAKAKAPDEVYEELKKALPAEYTVLEMSPAEDKDAVVVTKETAEKYKLKTIGDLAPVGDEIVLGGPPEWKTRESGVPGLKAVYGITFKEFKPLDTGGPLTVQALKNGQVQAANLFTTDPNVAANGFVPLEDPKSLFAAQNVVPLLAKSAATPQVTEALNAVSAKLDTPTLAALVKEVVTDKKDAADVANEFLTKNSLG